MMTQSGYFRSPTVCDDNVVFVCEDDLWQVSAQGGIATRLTSNLGTIIRPFLSPDGKQLAFTVDEEGSPEVYVIGNDQDKEPY